MPYELQAGAVASVHSVKLDHNACSNHTAAYAHDCHDTIVLTQRHNHHSTVYLCISVFDTSDKGMQWHCDVCSGDGWTSSIVKANVLDAGGPEAYEEVYVGSPLFALPFSSHTHDMHLYLSLPMLHPYYCRAVPYELQARAVASVHNVKLDHHACSNHTMVFVMTHMY